MADQHLKGAVSTAKGSVEDVLGKATGGKKLEAKGKAHKVQGKAHKVQGKAQSKLGDVQGRGRMHPMVISALGAAIVLAVTGLLTGVLRMGRNSG